MIKLFKQFISESGNAIKNSTGFKQSEVEPAVKWVQEKIFPELGLEGIGIDAVVIGSAGKKGPDQLSGDIDIAVSVDKISGFLHVPLDKKQLLEAISKKIKESGYESISSSGLSQVSIGIPIPGRNNEVGQVDLMLSTDLEWSKFIYHSPDFRKAESRYKGAYRNMLLMSAIGKSNYTVLKKTDTGETEEYESYVIRLDQGITQVRKTFMGKRGLKKTPELLKDYDKLITKTPQDVVNILFTNSKPSDIDTYEKLKGLIESDKFKFKDKREDVYEEFIERIEISGLPIPDDIKIHESFSILKYENFIKK